MKVLVLFVNIRRYNERVLKFLTYEEARFSCCIECEYDFVRRKNEEDKMRKGQKKMFLQSFCRSSYGIRYVIRRHITSKYR